MATKKVIMKQKSGSGFDILHPQTEVAQIIDFPEYVNGALMAHFSINTEKHPIEVNTSVEYSEGAICICDKTFAEIKAALMQHKLVVGVIDDCNARKIHGYKYNGKFYEDAQHHTLMAPDPDKIYVDNTSGQNNASYRFVPSHYDEFICDEQMWAEEGYYNDNDGKFYEDSSFSTEMEASEYTPYKDIPSQKVYAYIEECFIRSTVEDALMQIGSMQISTVTTPGNMIKFQLFNDNIELSILGYQPVSPGTPEQWGMNIKIQKYQDVLSMVQTMVNKGNCYPSCAAVIDYVNQQLNS